MATAHSRTAARAMLSPAVLLLLAWMIVPLALTLWFSLLRYNLLMPGSNPFVGIENHHYFLTDPVFTKALVNTLALVGGVLFVTIVGGTLLALLLDQPMWGQGVVRILVIAPFFVMPTVSALVWKNMFMNPVSGLFAEASKAVGMAPFDFLAQAPLLSIIGTVSWQWLPFATLILLTALQSLDSEQLEAAEMDGASAFSRFRFMIVPHLARAATVVILIQTIFLLSIFAEIPGDDERRPRQRHDEPDLPRLRPVPAAVRRGAGLGGRRRGDHPRQHRGGLPDAHDREEPRCVSRPMPPASAPAAPRT